MGKAAQGTGIAGSLQAGVVDLEGLLPICYINVGDRDALNRDSLLLEETLPAMVFCEVILFAPPFPPKCKTRALTCQETEKNLELQ